MATAPATPVANGHHGALRRTPNTSAAAAETSFASTLR
jgi:hypothetical protein